MRLAVRLTAAHHGVSRLGTDCVILRWLQVCSIFLHEENLATFKGALNGEIRTPITRKESEGAIEIEEVITPLDSNAITMSWSYFDGGLHTSVSAKVAVL
jgi:hypothetical protein